MNLSTNNSVNNLPNSIRCCPFCSASCHVTFEGINPLLFGVQCRCCRASIPATHTEYQDAVRAWNRRSGLAMLGGKATRGLRSRRKLAAARRNLKKARQTRQQNRTWRAVDAAYATLKPFREQELALAEASVARDRAELKALEPKIMSHPLLRKFYEELILKRDSRAGA